MQLKSSFDRKAQCKNPSLQGKGAGTQESLTITLTSSLAGLSFLSEMHPKVRMGLQEMLPAECIVQEIDNKVPVPGKAQRKCLN